MRDNIKQLKQQAFDLRAEASTLVAAAEKENRELTADEEARFEAIDVQVAALNKKIEREEKLAAFELQNKNVMAGHPAATEHERVELVRAEPVFKSIGEQMIAVKEASSPAGNSRSFENLMKVHAATGANEGADQHMEGTTS